MKHSPVSPACRVSLAMALCLPCTLAAAANQSPAEEELNQVIVVANRTPVAASKVGNSVTVLDEEKIVESQAAIVSDLLATTPGITVARNGGPGTLTAVRIRGAESDQTLVLIDGVQVNDPSSTGGGFDFGNLLVGDIGRIEVLRGSQSTLYGSQAIGGVVNIVTREPEGKLSANLQGEYGSENTTLLRGGVGGKFDRVSFRVAAARYDTDGVSAYDAGTETDPFRNTTFAGRFGYEFTPDISLDLRAYYADGKAHYDGYPPPNYVFADEGDYGTTETLVGYAGVNFALVGGALRNRIGYQYNSTDRGTFLDDGTTVFDNGSYKGKTNRFEYQGTWTISDAWQAVFGLQREDSETKSSSAPSFADVKQDSAYLQLQAGLAPGLTLTAGTRYDDHDTFGSHNSLQLAAAWALDSGTVLRASWGEGFKAPSLYQLYSPYANPSLKPESSKSWDAGIEQGFLEGRAVIGATYFNRRSTNLISFSSCPTPLNEICSAPGHDSYGYYTNTAKARAKGFELVAEVKPVDALTLAANYTHMKSTDESPGAATEGLRLLRRPDDQLNVSASYVWPVRLTTTVAARHASKSFDNNFNVFPSERLALDGYTLVDLRAALQVNDNLQLAARVENLFDEDYRAIFEYGTTGRAGYVSVNYTF
jgi:vitamin B12 transporter